MSIKENETNHQKKTTMELMCPVSNGGGWIEFGRGSPPLPPPPTSSLDPPLLVS